MAIDKHSAGNKEIVIAQFAKAPKLGGVKTRMMPVLSETQALQLHQQLVAYTFSSLVNISECQFELWVDSLPDHPFFTELVSNKLVSNKLAANKRIPIKTQAGADLGQRLNHAATEILTRAKFAIIVGSDCPFLDGCYLRQAIAGLKSGLPVVLGPANDGGYVLIGLAKSDSQLFAEIDWGTDRVLAQTRARLDSLGWQWLELPPQDDIDRPADLLKLPFIFPV